MLSSLTLKVSANCNCSGERTMGRLGITRAVFVMRGVLFNRVVFSARFTIILLVYLTYEGLVGLFNIGRLL